MNLFEDLWKLHQVEENSSISESDVVLQFAEQYMILWDDNKVQTKGIEVTDQKMSQDSDKMYTAMPVAVQEVPGKTVYLSC